jgi:hypothetical protein
VIVVSAATAQAVTTPIECDSRKQREIEPFDRERIRRRHEHTVASLAEVFPMPYGRELQPARHDARQIRRLPCAQREIEQGTAGSSSGSAA